MQTKTVTILMATYNGANYIKNQILSLQQQKYNNWQLYIQDDGSKDQTITIIKEMMVFDSRIHLVDSDYYGKGTGRNFLSLVKCSNSDYTIFCDQDDIWLENKISDMVKFADSLSLGSCNSPSIVYADGYAFSDTTGEIDFSGISHNHADGLKDFLFFNGGYQGCSIMFNRAMADFLIGYNGYIHLHDDIVSLAAHSLGQVHFLPKKLMLYRQHSNAVTGIKSFKKNIHEKLQSPVNYLLSHKHYSVKKSFYDNYHSLLSKDNSRVFDDFMRFCQTDNKLLQFIWLLYGGFRLNKSRGKLLLKFLLRRKFSE
ncbi:glycosyltransferase [Aeromonas caviae]|uniref:glycosyltransferase n=1 Tax=Aeromonas caviae TaxID=648 RepID=UPI00388F17F9